MWTQEDKKRSDKKYRNSHLEQIKIYERKRYLKNRNKILENRKKYREENKEKIYWRKRKYREVNREGILEKKRQYRLNNKEKVREGKRRHYLAHPEIKLAAGIRYLTKLGFPNKLTPGAYGHALNAWSKTVKKLGNGLCQICPNPATVSHHIIHKSKYPGLSLNVNNGISLCDTCHGESHGWN